MKGPNINNFIKDPGGGKYNIVAYRKLSKEEIMQQVSIHLAIKGAKRPKKGQVVHIITIIGHDA